MAKFISIDGTPIDEERLNAGNESIKRAMIEVFGKKYEGKICSILDRTTFGLYTSRPNDLSAFFYVCQRLLSSQEYKDFMSTNPSREEIQMTEHLIKSVAELVLNKPDIACSVVTTTREPLGIVDLCFYSADSGNITRAHEKTHQVSSKFVPVEQNGRICQRMKLGFRIHTVYEYNDFNEIYTEYLAKKIEKNMRQNKALPDGKYVPDTTEYDMLVMMFKDLFDENEDVLLSSYLGESIEPMLDRLGRENVENINASLGRLFATGRVHDRDEGLKIYNYMRPGLDEESKRRTFLAKASAYGFGEELFDAINDLKKQVDIACEYATSKRESKDR